MLDNWGSIVDWSDRFNDSWGGVVHWGSGIGQR